VTTTGPRAASGEHLPAATGSTLGVSGGFRQGLLSDLANPKIGIFFTSLLPQFVDPGKPVLLPFLALLSRDSGRAAGASPPGRVDQRAIIVVP
jgi:threonine/homoserine/homoserine lactone efflux protein